MGDVQTAVLWLIKSVYLGDTCLILVAMPSVL